MFDSEWCASMDINRLWRSKYYFGFYHVPTSYIVLSQYVNKQKILLTEHSVFQAVCVYLTVNATIYKKIDLEKAAKIKLTVFENDNLIDYSRNNILCRFIINIKCRIYKYKSYDT